MTKQLLQKVSAFGSKNILIIQIRIDFRLPSDEKLLFFSADRFLSVGFLIVKAKWCI